MNFSPRRALIAAAVSVSLAATAAPAATAQSSLLSLPSGLVSVNGTGIENGAFTGAIEKDGIKIPVTGTIENGAITGLKVDPNGVVGIAEGAFTGAIQKDGVNIPITGTIEKDGIKGVEVQPGGLVGVQEGAFTGAIEKDGVKIPITGTVENGAIKGAEINVDPNGIIGIQEGAFKGVIEKDGVNVPITGTIQDGAFKGVSIEPGGVTGTLEGGVLGIAPGAIQINPQIDVVVADIFGSSKFAETDAVNVTIPLIGVAAILAAIGFAINQMGLPPASLRALNLNL